MLTNAVSIHIDNDGNTITNDKCELDDIKNNVISFTVNPYTVNNATKKIEIPLDLFVIPYKKELLEIIYKIGFHRSIINKAVSSLTLYELLAEKIQYHIYLTAFGLISNVKISKYQHDKCYVDKYIKIPFVHNSETTIIGNINGEQICECRNHDKEKIAIVTMIGTNIIDITKNNKATSFDTNKISAFCSEVYKTMITLIDVAKRKKQSDNDIVTEMLKILNKTGYVFSDIDKMRTRYILTSLSNSTKNELMTLLDPKLNNDSFRNMFLMDLLSFYKANYTHKQELKISETSDEQYMQIHVAIPDGNTYEKLSVIDIVPYSFDKNTITQLMVAYNSYYIN